MQVLSRYGPTMREVQVMVLAAGYGTRLWPLTTRCAKPALPFVGRPLIRGVMDWLAAHGATRVVVNTHHEPETIRAALKDLPASLSVGLSHESVLLGTAGGLAQAVGAGLLSPDQTTLVVNAKLVTSIDLGGAFEAHRATRASVTMVVRTNAQKEAFTTVRTDGGWVTGFGPPRIPEGETPLAFTGIHFLEPSVLARAEARFSDTVRDLYPPEVAGGRVRAHVDDTGEWREPSTLARYLQLQVDTVGARGWRAGGAHIDPSARWVGTVVGDRANIGEGAVVEDSVLWPKARVGPGARVRRCILTEAVDIPAGSEVSDSVVLGAKPMGSPPSGHPTPQEHEGLWMVPIVGLERGSAGVLGSSS